MRTLNLVDWRQRSSRRYAYFVIQVAVLFLLVILVWQYMQHQKIRAEIQRVSLTQIELESRLQKWLVRHEKLQDIQSEVSQSGQEITNYWEAVEQKQKYWLVIHWLLRNWPNTLKLNSIAVEKNQVSIKASLSDQESIRALIANLRRLPQFKELMRSQIETTENKNAMTVVTEIIFSLK